MRVSDPEYPMSIVDLGLIYGVRVDEGVAYIDITFTSIGCPAIEMIVEDIHSEVGALPGLQTSDAICPAQRVGRIQRRCSDRFVDVQAGLERQQCHRHRTEPLPHAIGGQSGHPRDTRQGGVMEPLAQIGGDAIPVGVKDVVGFEVPIALNRAHGGDVIGCIGV